MTTVLSRDPARSRPPTDRPLDIVALELLLSISQALLVGILLSMASDLGGDARAAGLPVPGVTAVLGLAVGATWVWWLVGGSGWLLAAVDLGIAVLTGALWLLSLQDPTAPHIDPLVGLIAVSCAVGGIVGGAFLPGPRRGHWKGGESRPRRGLPETRTSPARFSPPVQKVVDERLASVSFSSVRLRTVRLPAARLPALRLPSRATAPEDADDDEGSGGLTAVPLAVTLTARSSASVAPAPSSDADATEAVHAPVIEPTIPTGVHRIVPATAAEPEPLSVSAMRLASAAQMTAGLEDDDDETLPVVSAGPGRPGAGDDAADPDATDAHPATDDSPDHREARPDA